ncbi:DNA repair protein RecN [bacterium]|nr:DNA repair protein RecN [bacterium]
MILRIKFKNFVLIKELELEFQKGMNVITGETGAGKSVLVGGLNLVLGGMVRGNYFYEKDRNIYLEVDFSIDSNNLQLLELIDKYSIEAEENELFFVKEINTKGKTVSFINGRRVTNSIIKEFRDVLLDFHSQNEQLNLNEQDYQLQILDAYGELDKLRDELSSYYIDWQKEKQRLKDLLKKEKELAEKTKLYEYQVAELEAMNLRQGELEDLDHEYKVLINADRIVSLSREVIQEFYEEENSLIDRFSSALNKLSEFSEDLSQIKAANEFFYDAKTLIEDGISSLREVEDRVSLDSERLLLVEERIRSIEDIKSKYHLNSVELILDYFQEINEFLLNKSQLTSEIQKQKDVILAIEAKLLKLANSLSQKRRTHADNLKAEIEANIENLSLPKAKVMFAFNVVTEEEKLKELTQTGYDQVNLLFSANMGVDLQPLKESASGGELSRMLLALKKILSDKLQPRSIIFDEIDVGIGGNTALYIADYIAKIGDKHQVLCITHLPQVAAKGSNHFKILKTINRDKTEIIINLLTAAERELEISRMLAGTTSETSLKHAQEILNYNNKEN